MQRKLPSPGFQAEVVLVDYDGTVSTRLNTETAVRKSDEGSSIASPSVDAGTSAPKQNKDSGSKDKDDVFSDNEAEESVSSKRKQAQASSASSGTDNNKTDKVASLTQSTEQLSLGNTSSQQSHAPAQPKSEAAGGTVSSGEASNSQSEFKAMAADASVFTFGDEDYESE